MIEKHTISRDLVVTSLGKALGKAAFGIHDMPRKTNSEFFSHLVLYMGQIWGLLHMSLY